MKYLVIGGSIAGTTAAETIRNIDSDAEITIATNEQYPLYSRITIAAAAGGEVAKENLILRKTEQYASKRITFYTNLEAKSIDRETKTVTLQDSDGAITTLMYDKLLVATGGISNMIQTQGSNGNGIFYMHNLDDASTIHDYATGKQKAVVAGGSFIGIDFLTAFTQLGLDIDFLIRGEGFLYRLFNKKVQDLIHRILESHGIHVKTYTEIDSFVLDEGNNLRGVQTKNNEFIECQVAGLGLGITRISPFVASLGLPTKTGLLTNEYLQTTDPHIFAAGDVVERYDPNLGRYTLNGDWLSARLEGEIAGKNMTGQQIPYLEIPSNTSNIFGVNATIIGQIDQEGTLTYDRERETSYLQIFTKDDILIGGVVIGDNAYANALKAAIKEKKKATSIDI